MSNFRIFAWGWCLAYAGQLILRVLGFGPPGDLRDLVAGTVMATAWGFSAVAALGDRKPEDPRP
jgi:hypothetical protein